MTFNKNQLKNSPAVRIESLQIQELQLPDLPNAIITLTPEQAKYLDELAKEREAEKNPKWPTLKEHFTIPPEDWKKIKAFFTPVPGPWPTWREHFSLRDKAKKND